jgi:hypothetical protein
LEIGKEDNARPTQDTTRAKWEEQTSQLKGFEKK